MWFWVGCTCKKELLPRAALQALGAYFDAMGRVVAAPAARCAAGHLPARRRVARFGAAGTGRHPTCRPCWPTCARCWPAALAVDGGRYTTPYRLVRA